MKLRIFMCLLLCYTSILECMNPKFPTRTPRLHYGAQVKISFSCQGRPTERVYWRELNEEVIAVIAKKACEEIRKRNRSGQKIRIVHLAGLKTAAEALKLAITTQLPGFPALKITVREGSSRGAKTK